MNIQNIQIETRALVDADTSSYPASLMLIRNNTAMEEIADKILDCDGRWQWDDANNVDYPGGVAGLSSLVSGTKNYAIDTTFIKILGGSVLDVNGKWYKLLPFDPDDLAAMYGPFIDRAQFLSVNGRPLYYDLTGSSIILYPAPDNGVTVTLTNGLKIYAQRTAQLFTTAEVTTGTKVPGFASPFHILVAYKSALPYAMAYKPARVPFIVSEIARMEKELVEFYSRRDKDERHIMTARPILFR